MVLLSSEIYLYYRFKFINFIFNYLIIKIIFCKFKKKFNLYNRDNE